MSQSHRTLGPFHLVIAFAILAIGSAAWASRSSTDLGAVLDQTALIVEVEVVEVDISAGKTTPETRLSARLLKSWGETSPPKHLTLSLPQGLTPDRRHWVGPIHAPGYVPGERYLLLLRRGDWRLHPVADWGWGSLRLTTVSGRDVALDEGGACVTGVSDKGLALGPVVAEPVDVPGRGALWHAESPRPEAIKACLSLAALRDALGGHLAQAGWRPDRPGFNPQPVELGQTTPAARVTP